MLYNTEGKVESGRESVLEMMQPMPVPLEEMPLQHARVLGELQVEVDLAGEGLGRAVAAMATERTERMVLNCILVVGEDLEGWGLRVECEGALVEKFLVEVKTCLIDGVVDERL